MSVQPPARIEAIAFDLYGTLLDVTDIQGVPAEVVATLRQKQLQYSWLVSLMSEYRDFRDVTRAAAEYAVAHHGVSDVGAARLVDAQRDWPPYAEVPAALEELGHGRRLAILSNGHPDSLEAVLTAAGLRDRFELVLSVHEVRVFKPAPAVYQLGLDRLGVGREQLLFVSSNGWDAAGAAAFGLRVAWVNRAGLTSERVGGQPELVVANLAELTARLARPNG